MDLTYLSHFFPKGLLEYFDIIDFKELLNEETIEDHYEIVLEEKNIILGDIDASLYESKGFTNVSLQDFPIRGKAVYLKFKRRRWRLKTDKNKIIRNEFSYVAVGSGFTHELSDFLKGIDQYKGRYSK